MPGTTTKTDFEHLAMPDVLKQLGVDLRTGLADAEAKQRLMQYGPNALEEKKTSPWAMFGKFFWGPMPWMIEAAALMSILVKDWVDFSIILVLLLFNAVLGFWHERQAASALDALKGALAQEAQALRDSKWQTILANTITRQPRQPPGRSGCTGRLTRFKAASENCLNPAKAMSWSMRRFAWSVSVRWGRAVISRCSWPLAGARCSCR